MAFINGLWLQLTVVHLTKVTIPSVCKVTVLKFTTVHFVNGLRLLKKWPVQQQCVFVCVCVRMCVYVCVYACPI